MKQEEIPNVKFEEGEKVEYVFRRSQILTVMIIVGEILATCLFIALLIYMNSDSSIRQGNFFFLSNNSTRNSLFLMTGILYLVIVMAGLISLHVNRSNVLYITNRRAIQTTTVTLFAHSLNIISLRNVEDVSFKKKSVFDHLFKIGQLRLSTVGDETTYTFPHIDEVSSDTILQISQLVSDARLRWRKKLENSVD